MRQILFSLVIALVIVIGASYQYTKSLRSDIQTLERENATFESALEVSNGTIARLKADQKKTLDRLNTLTESLNNAEITNKFLQDRLAEFDITGEAEKDSDATQEWINDELRKLFDDIERITTE